MHQVKFHYFFNLFGIFNIFLDSVEKDYTKHIEKKKDLVLHYKHLQIQAKVIEELEEINDETKEYLLFFAKNNGFYMKF